MIKLPRKPFFMDQETWVLIHLETTVVELDAATDAEFAHFEPRTDEHELVHSWGKRNQALQVMLYRHLSMRQRVIHVQLLINSALLIGLGVFLVWKLVAPS